MASEETKAKVDNTITDHFASEKRKAKVDSAITDPFASKKRKAKVDNGIITFPFQRYFIHDRNRLFEELIMFMIV